MRLVKIKEGQQFKFFASNAIGVHANKFQSTDKVISNSDSTGLRGVSTLGEFMSTTTTIAVAVVAPADRIVFALLFSFYPLKRSKFKFCS